MAKATILMRSGYGKSDEIKKLIDLAKRVIEENTLPYADIRHQYYMVRGWYYAYKYIINRHYVDEWERNSEFEIGDPIYFEQIIDFNNLGPYNTIYEYDGRCFSIAARRR